MPYCTYADLLKAVPARTLAQLSNDVAPATTPDMAVIERAMQKAGELIDGHLRSRYALPLKDVPTILQDLAVSLVRHSLYGRRPEGKEDLPPAVVRDYKGAIDTLGHIKKGNITLGIESTQKTQPEPGKMRVRAGSRVFPRSLVDRY